MSITANEAATFAQVDPPPQWNPGAGRRHYLPEDAYFIDEAFSHSRDWINRAIKTIVECAAAFADRYEAAPLPATPSVERATDRIERRGAIPSGSADRAVNRHRH